MNFRKLLKKIKRPVVWGNILGLVVFITAFITGVMIFISNYTRHGESIEVPDLRGLKPEAAMMRLEALGLSGVVTDTGYVTTKPPYTLLEQSIAPGKHVKIGRTLTFTINGNGARPVLIPDLANNTSVREAEARLRTLGFTQIKYKYIDGDPDWVYSILVKGKEVYKNQRISIDQPVTLVVGKSETPEDVDFEEEKLSNLFYELVDSI
jgi:beta-lactam-binding protein with PASTA domain